MNERCPRCAERNMTTDYEEQVKSYINSIPEEIRTPPDEYQRRLDICKGCDEHTYHQCAICGCYVEMRAAKMVMYCPLSYDRWSGEPIYAI